MGKGDRFPHVLDEEFSLFESRGVCLDAKGRQRPFPILDDHVEAVEDIEDGSTRSESGQLESLANADALRVLVDRLDDAVGPRSQPKRGFRAMFSRCWRLY